MNNKLRVGVLVDSNLIPHWAFEMLNQVKCGNYAEIVLIVKNGSSAEAVNQNIFHKAQNILKSIFISIFNKLDPSFGRLEVDAFKLQDIYQLLPRVPSITVKPIQKISSDYFDKDDIAQIQSVNVDVLIRLGFGILRGDVLTCTKYGVWSYHNADNSINRGTPAGFWEVMENWPETDLTLQILTENVCGGKILFRSYFLTGGPEFFENINRCYMRILSFIPRKLKELHELGEKKFLSRINQDNQHPAFYSRKFYTPPRTIESILLYFYHFSRLFWKRLEYKFYFEQWLLLYRIDRSNELTASFWKFKKIIPPKDREWADPFVIFKNDTYFIFIEECMYKTGKGHISCLTMDKEGNYSMPEKIIEKPYHVSYPFVFIHDNEYYMIPETSSNRTIDLYKCVEFPNKWEFKETLINNICAFDATLLNKDGKWWLFATIVENKGAPSTDELFLFFSSKLFSGNWTPHPLNPIVSDVRSARPAGNIFSYNQNIYRPSQNSSKKYGYGMKMNQIVTLTEYEYKEVCVDEVEPLWDKNIFCCHTFNYANGLTVIDGMTKRSKYFC
jgi:hypothetical protein